jgi:hypothetical protein
MVQLSSPWANSIGAVLLTQHPRDYYINVVVDDAGHAWLTKDFGQTWIDLNQPGKSNLLDVSGHTTVDTMLIGAVLFVNVTINGVQPLIIGTPYGAFISFDALTASPSNFVRLGANLANTIPTSYVYTDESDTLVVHLRSVSERCRRVRLHLLRLLALADRLSRRADQTGQRLRSGGCRRRRIVHRIVQPHSRATDDGTE